MKAALLFFAFLASFAATACESGLAGVYALRNAEGALIETLHLKWQSNKLAAFARNDAGGWGPNLYQTQPFSAQAFASFTKLPAPPNYCGILVAGLIFARVPANWQWAGFSTQSGFTVISLGGPRAIYRVKP